MKNSWTRKKVMRVFIAPLCIALAVAACVMAVLNLTIFKPSKVSAATATTSSTYVVTNPGVANMVDDEVLITATIKETAAQRAKAVTGDENADKRTVCVAVGRSTDVDAWMKAQGVAYTVVSGLKSWSQLSTQTVAKSGQAAKDAVDMGESDLWSQVNCAERTATLRLTGAQGNQRVVMYSPSSISSIRLQWMRSTLPNTSAPWFSASAVLAVLAILSFTWLAGDDPFGSQRRKKAREEAAAAAAAAGQTGAAQEGVPGIDTPYVPYQKKSTSGITHRTRKQGVFGKLFESKKNQSTDQNRASSEPSVSAENEQTNKPIIVDPSSVNLVASTGAGANDTAWSPAVINRPAASAVGEDTQTNLSGEELLEYFARLAIEDRSQSGDAATEASSGSTTGSTDPSGLSGQSATDQGDEE